jgi:hypothetical protein
MHTAFTAIDAVIVLGYLAALAAVGVYFSRRQTIDRRLLRGASIDGVAAGRPVADGGAQQRHRLPDAAVGDDPLRCRAARGTTSWSSCIPGSRASRCRSIRG